jgi:hypothetical protein
MKIPEILKKFKTEELAFGSLFICTLIINTGNGIPGMIISLLLALYFLVFGWYLFPVGDKKNMTLSISSGIVYAICLTCIAIYSGNLYQGFFFLYVEGALLLPLSFYLIYRTEGETYKKLHLIRITIIIALSVYLFMALPFRP